MQKNTTKKNTKRVAIVGATTAALLGGGVAFAYWTTSGSGSGSATTDTGASNTLTFDQATPTTADTLFPGGPARIISGRVTNTGDQSVYVTQVVAEIDSVKTADGAAIDGCDASNYEVVNPTGGMSVGEDLAKDGYATFTGATIAFVDKTTSQDACKGAVVHLTFTAS